MPISKRTIKSGGGGMASKMATKSMSASKKTPVSKTSTVSMKKTTGTSSQKAKMTASSSSPAKKVEPKNPYKVVTTTVSHPSNPNASMGVKLRVGANEKVPSKISSGVYEREYKSKRVR